MHNEFKPGDVVRFRTGGPTMIVIEVEQSALDPDVWHVTCQWFDGKKAMQHVFLPFTLEKVPPSDPGLQALADGSAFRD